jgi:hypothetical protein
MNALVLVQHLLEDRTNMFVSAVLTPQSQRRLLEMVPPVHPIVYAHHVTLAFNPEPDVLERYRSLEGTRIRVPVTAVCVDEKAQAVLVGVDSENEYPHITISVAEGVPPAYSNELLAAQHADMQHVNIFTLEADVVIEPLES